MPNYNMRTLLRSMLFAVLLAPVAAYAQPPAVTSADVQRLQDELSQGSSDLAKLKSTDPNRAARLQVELDDLREEVAYLRIKLRREGSVPRPVYLEIKDNIEVWRASVRGTGERQGGMRVPGGAPPATETRPSAPRQSPQSSSSIPVGQEIDVRLQTQLSSETAQPEDRFEATTIVDLRMGDEVLIPAGSLLRGVVRTVNRATRTDRKGELTVAFDQITVRGRSYPMRGTVTQALESEGMKGEVGRIGAGAGVGGVIGGIIGGVKGALLGILIGGGGTIAATEGREVTLPPGTILRVRLDTPPDIR